jgi:hypothetical protein
MVSTPRHLRTSWTVNWTARSRAKDDNGLCTTACETLQHLHEAGTLVDRVGTTARTQAFDPQIYSPEGSVRLAPYAQKSPALSKSRGPFFSRRRFLRPGCLFPAKLARFCERKGRRGLSRGLSRLRRGFADLFLLEFN